MNIAQEVFIDHEPSTITYEVGFRLVLIEKLIHIPINGKKNKSINQYMAGAGS